jgi:hypothetical protein
MAIRDKIRTNAQAHLQPGEQIQAVMGAQAASPFLAIISFWIIIAKDAYRIIVVTDRRILLCKTGRMTVTPVKSVIREYPRSTKLGPASGLWHTTEALGEKLWIHKRYFKDIETADSATPLAQ